MGGRGEAEREDPRVGEGATDHGSFMVDQGAMPEGGLAGVYEEGEAEGGERG